MSEAHPTNFSFKREAVIMKLKKILPAILLGWLVLVVVAAPAVRAQQPPATAPERELFTQGQKYYARGNYDNAVNSFRQLLTDYPQTPIRDLALLWMGRSYLKAGRMAEAEVVGEALRGIPDTPFADIYATELRLAREQPGETVRPAPSAEASPVTAMPTPPAPAPQPTATPVTPTVVAAATPTPDAERKTSETVSATPIPPDTAASSAPITTDPQAAQPPSNIATPTTATTAPVAGSLPSDESRSSEMINLRLVVAQPEYTLRPGGIVKLPVRIFNDGVRDSEFVFEALTSAGVSAAFTLTPDGAPGAADAKLKTPLIAANSYADIWLTLRVTDASDLRRRQVSLPLVATVADNPSNNTRLTIALTIDSQSGGTDTKNLAQVDLAAAATPFVISVAVAPNRARSGDILTQTITLLNRSPRPLENARLQFKLGGDFELAVEDSAVDFTFDRSAHTVTFNLAPLEAGATHEFKLVLQVKKGAGNFIPVATGRGKLIAAGLSTISFDGARLKLDDK